MDGVMVEVKSIVVVKVKWDGMGWEKAGLIETVSQLFRRTKPPLGRPELIQCCWA